MATSIENSLNELFCVAKVHPAPNKENKVPLCLKDEKRKDVYVNGEVSYGTIDLAAAHACKKGYALIGYVPEQKARLFKTEGVKQLPNERLLADIPFLCGDEKTVESMVQAHSSGIPLFFSSIGESSSNSHHIETSTRFLIAGGAIVLGAAGRALHLAFLASKSTGLIGAFGGLLWVFAIWALLYAIWPNPSKH